MGAPPLSAASATAAPGIVHTAADNRMHNVPAAPEGRACRRHDRDVEATEADGKGEQNDGMTNKSRSGQNEWERESEREREKDGGKEGERERGRNGGREEGEGERVERNIKRKSHRLNGGQEREGENQRAG